MITVISGTNRTGSITLAYAEHFAKELRRQGAQAQLLDLCDFSFAGMGREMYDPTVMTPALKDLQETYILGAEKLAILSPEYNGSYPGVLKLFIDGISVNEYGRNFKGKILALIGISSGRAGNLRGMDHLADTLAHMGAWVLPNRLPISLADTLLEGQTVTDAGAISSLKGHAQQLISA